MKVALQSAGLFRSGEVCELIREALIFLPITGHFRRNCKQVGRWYAGHRPVFEPDTPRVQIRLATTSRTDS
jgi:hypothetical protein